MHSAFLETAPLIRPVTAKYLRAPEIVLGLPFDQSIDVWCFGVLVFEPFTGCPMFHPGGFWGPESAALADDDHLLQMAATLGKLPTDLNTA